MSITRCRSTAAMDGDTTQLTGSRGSRAWRRFGRSAIIVAAGTGALALAGPMGLRPFVDATEAAGAAGDVTVAFVLDFGTGTTPVVGCVNVPASDNRYGALSAFVAQKGMAPPSYAPSGLLCSINGIPSTGCGQMVNGHYIYWSYFTGGTGDWTYSNTGASGQVTLGDVEGWRFQTSGNGNPTDPNPNSTAQFTSICAPGTATTSTIPITTTTSSAPGTEQQVPPQSGAAASAAAGSVVTGGDSSTTTHPSTSTTTHPATSPPAVSVPAAPVAALGIADHPAGASGPGSGPVIIGGLLVISLGIAAFARWRKRPRTP